VQRFPHAHQLEASLGLVPCEYSSGDTQRPARSLRRIAAKIICR
jgi:transposase